MALRRTLLLAAVGLAAAQTPDPVQPDGDVVSVAEGMLGLYM